MTADTPKRQEDIVEAVLFTFGSSVDVAKLAEALGSDEKEAAAAAERLAERYDESASALQIIKLENSYQMCTRPEYYDNLIRVAQSPKKPVLTDVLMETLAIIAYRQPVTKSDIEKIRGVNADHAVNRLVEYGLVCEVGRLDAPGKPVLFATTEEFLRRFGISSPEDLPEMAPEDIDEIRGEVEDELFSEEPDTGQVRMDTDGRNHI